MCGIVLFAGPNASEKMHWGINKLRHRGPDDAGTWEHGNISIGFARLAINGNLLEGQQPLINGSLCGVINGEIYNHVELKERYGLAKSDSDAKVLLPLFKNQGPRLIEEIDGFYSAVIHEPQSNKVTCIRDRMGKKPLFYGQSNTELFIVSELKIVEYIQWFKPIPKGVSEIDINTGELEIVATHEKTELKPNKKSNLESLFKSAIVKRLPKPDQPLGVFLSGGLDSSLIAEVVSQHRPDAVYFTLGESGPDFNAADLVAKHLDLKHVQTIPLPAVESLLALLHDIVRITESYNPSIVSNGLATYLLAKAAKNEDIKVVLTGEGADELFGGYHHFNKQDDWHGTRNKLINDMHLTELRRLDMACMANNVEPRCPFLDSALLDYSNGLSFDDLYNKDQNKIALRQHLNSSLPTEVIHRKKTSLDVGSGMRRTIVRFLTQTGITEREALKEIWKQHYDLDASNPYFHAYPVFDNLIDKRGVTHK